MDKVLIRTLTKDDVLKDFHARWSIDRKCDSVILESSHPLRPPDSKILTIWMVHELFIYTHECNANEKAYFKVDMNLIPGLDNSYLG